jgi:hypothetical protein
MTFVLRLAGGVVLTLVVVAVLLVSAYALIWVFNRGLQWGAENIGGELGNMFRFIRSKLPRIRFERSADVEKPESGKTV